MIIDLRQLVLAFILQVRCDEQTQNFESIPDLLTQILIGLCGRVVYNIHDLLCVDNAGRQDDGQVEFRDLR